MKKLLIILASILGIGAIGFIGFRFYTKLASPEISIEYAKDGLNVKIFYCQPSKKGRDIFGKVVAYNKVWRTGANEATQITFDKDVKIAGQALKAGTYAFFTIPNPDKWVIIFNTKLGTWGHFGYDEKKDALRVEVPTTTVETVAEKLSLTCKEAENNAVNLEITWDKTVVNIPISL
jgi:hypothetical protein